MKSIFLVLLFICSSSIISLAQTNSKPVSDQVRSSAAFAEILLRQTEIESELEELRISYTEDFPKVKDARYELEELNKSLERISALKPAETNKLSSALGKLFVRRARIATDYRNVRNRLNEKHPETQKAKRKLEIFDRAIDRIMG